MIEAATEGVLLKKLFLKISQNSEQNACVGLSFNNVAGLQVCNLTKMTLQHSYLPVNVAQFLRTLILNKISNGCFCSVPEQKKTCMTRVELDCVSIRLFWLFWWKVSQKLCNNFQVTFWQMYVHTLNLWRSIKN